MSFTNSHIEDLPACQEQKKIPLESNYIISRTIIGGLFTAAIILFGATESYLFSGTSLPNIALQTLITASLSIYPCYLIWLDGKLRGYSVREQDITSYEGVVFRSISIQPFRMVQHSKVTISPIEERLGLATLEVFNAAGRPTLIPGLTLEKANQLKSFVNDRSGKFYNEE